MAVGSSFAAMNTMYAAVARRSKEIGTLRVLGFSRFSILLSFLSESVLLAILGGALGFLLVLPLNGTTTGIGNFTTFSDTDFNGGVNFIVGMRRQNGAFFEMRATAWGVSNIRLLAGFNF